jgi:hypothetical protein
VQKKIWEIDFEHEDNEAISTSILVRHVCSISSKRDGHSAKETIIELTRNTRKSALCV